MNEGFKISETPKQEKPPEVAIPTQDLYHRTTQERHLHAIPDQNISYPEELPLKDKNKYFDAAFENIVGSKKLERLVIKALKRTDVKDMTSFASVMNTFTEYCVSLTDREIDDLLRNFKSGLIKHVNQYREEFKLSDKDVQDIQMGRLGADTFDESLNTTGVKSVARFVRARKKLHEVSPQTIPAFYFQDFLDAQHKIDLIELIEGPDGYIMNLIQIKSKDYKEGEIDTITHAHRRWVNENAMNMEAFEKNFSIEEKDSFERNNFWETVEGMEIVFIDILTQTINPTVESVMEKLQLRGLPEGERVWALSHFTQSCLDFLNTFRENNDAPLTGLQIQAIEDFFNSILQQVEIIAKQDKDFKGISEIHSISTNAETVVYDEVIFNATGSQRKTLKMK